MLLPLGLLEGPGQLGEGIPDGVRRCLHIGALPVFPALRKLPQDGPPVRQFPQQRMPELLPVSDMIVIARGDLGAAFGIYALPPLQKRLAAACRAAGAPFMVVTQLLYSMQQNPVPTRAEVSDIYNAVLDGAAALMLTNETAAGKYPAEAMRALVLAAGADS